MLTATVEKMGDITCQEPGLPMVLVGRHGPQQAAKDKEHKNEV
jgi:hypothetical protein